MGHYFIIQLQEPNRGFVFYQKPDRYKSSIKWQAPRSLGVLGAFFFIYFFFKDNFVDLRIKVQATVQNLNSNPTNAG